MWKLEFRNGHYQHPPNYYASVCEIGQTAIMGFVWDAPTWHLFWVNWSFAWDYSTDGQLLISTGVIESWFSGSPSPDKIAPSSLWGGICQHPEYSQASLWIVLGNTKQSQKDSVSGTSAQGTFSLAGQLGSPPISVDGRLKKKPDLEDAPIALTPSDIHLCHHRYTCSIQSGEYRGRLYSRKEIHFYRGKK